MGELDGFVSALKLATSGTSPRVKIHGNLTVRGSLLVTCDNIGEIIEKEGDSEVFNLVAGSVECIELHAKELKVFGDIVAENVCADKTVINRYLPSSIKAPGVKASKVTVIGEMLAREVKCSEIKARMIEIVK